MFLSIFAAHKHLSCLCLRWGPVRSLRMPIRTTTTPPTVSSCTWTWGTKCVCSWTGAKFTGETPTNTAPSLASSSTPTDSILMFIYSLFCNQANSLLSILHLTLSFQRSSLHETWNNMITVNNKSLKRICVKMNILLYILPLNIYLWYTRLCNLCHVQYV